MLKQRILDWLGLTLMPEIGPARIKTLLEIFGSPGKILAASEKKIASVLGSRPAQEIQRQRKDITGRIREQLRLIDKYRVSIISQDDGDYPANLKNIFDPPLILFVRGQNFSENEFPVAIVGTRMATIYGMNMSRKISSRLGECGFTIISGGARGIDTAAHQAALGVKARTVSVLGCGLDIAYPAENKSMFEQIIRNGGALVSEFPMGTSPIPQNFPRRNRIISGLSAGVVVIEAPQKSGALITACFALEQGREVFCVPGQADSFASKGSHQLLKEGAILIEDAEDIIEQLRPLIQIKGNANEEGRNQEFFSHC